MATFSVQFAEANGRRIKQVIEAVDERAALSTLEARGVTPISITAAAAGKKEKKQTVRRVKGGKSMRRAMLDFTHQMAAVAESGIPIIAGLKAVGEQTGQPELRAGIQRIAGRVEGGRTLADAIDMERSLFPEIYAKTIAAGEAAGKLPEVLNSLASYMEQEYETRGQIRSALTYPAMVVGTLVLATGVLLVFVIPQFAELFQKFESDLPLPTKILLGISGALINHYILLLLGAVALYFGVRKLLSLPAVRSWLDYRILKLPVFGNLLIGIYMVRFIELLDLLIEAALPITNALRVTADSMTNEALRKDVRGMLKSVEGGRSLTDAFSRTEWLTPLVKRMLAIGEQSGRTDQIFAYLKKYYSDQTQRSVKLLSTLIEPIMVISLAAVVLFFALSIFMPMWKLLKLVGTG